MGNENLRYNCFIRRLTVVFVILSGCCQNTTIAQHSSKWEVAVAAYIPTGSFSETHFPGGGSEISFTDGRFGRLKDLPKKKLGSVVKAGTAYFPGKKRNISGYSFRYGGYSLLHIYGGGIYNMYRKINFQVSTGPALSLYKHNIRFNIGSSLSGTYYISPKTGISPAFQMINEWGARPLWYGSVKVSRVF